VAVLLAPTIVATNRSGSSAFALEVLSDGRIHVRVAADLDDGHRLQQELQGAGVKADIMAIESHPMLVGTIEFPQHQLPPEGVERGKGEFWIDPATFDGTIEILIHVAPDPGKDWIQAPSVFHPEEPLGGLPCAISGPIDTATLERRAQEVGITKFVWLVTEGDPGASQRNVERASERPEGEVEHAERIGPEKLRVGVRTAAVVDRFGHAGPPPMNLTVHESAEPSCTPELAARWLTPGPAGPDQLLVDGPAARDTIGGIRTPSWARSGPVAH